MEIVSPLLKEAGGYFMAGVFLYLFLQERKDNKDTTKQVVEVIQDNSTNLRILTEKIQTAKKG